MNIDAARKMMVNAVEQAPNTMADLVSYVRTSIRMSVNGGIPAHNLSTVPFRVVAVKFATFAPEERFMASECAHIYYVTSLL